MYQCYDCLMLLKKRNKSDQHVYYVYIRNTVAEKLNFQLSWIIDSSTFDPFNCYNIDSCFIGTCFSQYFFEWWWLESNLNNFQCLCLSFMELEDERIRMPLQCIRIRLPSIRMFFSASRYCVYSRFGFAISCAILSLNRVDSLYSFHKHLLMLFVSYYEH